MLPHRLAAVRQRIAEAAARAGREPADVRLIAVSKTFPIEAVREAYDAGQRDFGENRVQEAVHKIASAGDSLTSGPSSFIVLGRLPRFRRIESIRRMGAVIEGQCTSWR